MTTTLDLAALDSAVEASLSSRDETALHVLGYGEISTVLAWPKPDGPFACKRLPTFDDSARFEAYRAVFDASIDTLVGRGLAVHPTSLDALPRGDGTVAAYCVQRVLPTSSMAPERLRGADREQGRALLARISDTIGTVVDDHVGLDAQLSNWAEVDGALVYLDVTTPLLRDDTGADLLDTDLFLASIPAALHPMVRRFVLPSILDTYFAARPITLDLVGNLHKEHLGEWVPDAITIFNARFDLRLTDDEVRRYYRRDARLWAWMQRVRRLDRAWQRWVRRRPYPLLLPGPVER
ncbi:MAG TPA: DUF6206 family protein [Acidimicrobiia bacterium]|nr:DUF6206 family protein [Acidimicrobiia bacterium]